MESVSLTLTALNMQNKFSYLYNTKNKRLPSNSNAVHGVARENMHVPRQCVLKDGPISGKVDFQQIRDGVGFFFFFGKLQFVYEHV